MAPFPAPERHTLFDDAQGIFTGTLFVSLAMVIFNQAGLLTGGTAGVAFVLHYATGVSFGKLFFLVNLPFYWFSWTRMGREFTIKTFLSIALLSLLADWSPRVFDIADIHPLYAALVGGLLLGTGCLFLARHRASLGGATIVTLYLQEKHGLRAGKVQMGIDSIVVLLALLVVPPERVAYSVMAAVLMSLFLWVNHKPGRYTVT
ncbi:MULTISPECIES: YitT family protein [unclassified Polaromonas]|uniref:YitT family protein n=1 Tax=unclassified Polaromonas TaxID=2638319 RepID=UPI000F081A6F|nr:MULTISPECIES: YitT family protein [unclassified Polaromonas]AYQ30217.1 YitT family protein [Polaromonas sp. SP1]QGJ18667.1 YitT family protein [Polaromonas sp. Pch-P]